MVNYRPSDEYQIRAISFGEEQKEFYVQRDRARILRNSRDVRRTQLLYNYGMSVEEYDKLFKKQNGKCEICGKHQSEVRKTFSVDHSHKTGKVRGLLCNNCNTGIGFFEDKPSSLIEAVKYLNRNREASNDQS